MSASTKAVERVVVWDLPTRIFHWLLAAAFLIEWLTQDDARYLDFHVFFGYVIGGLILFRIVWGFVGTRWARLPRFAICATFFIVARPTSWDTIPPEAGRSSSC